MDPVTFFTAASAVGQQLGQWALSGAIGNATYAGVRRALPAVASLLRSQGQPLNHHLQRAFRAAYLAATRRIVASAKPNPKLTTGTLIGQDSRQWFERAMKWLTAEEGRLKDERYEPPLPPGGWEPSVVVEPSNEDAAKDVARLRTSLEQMLRNEWAAAKLGAVPDSVSNALAHGWTEQTQDHTNWFDLISLYFAQELKARPEVRAIFDSGTLATVLIELRGLREEMRDEMSNRPPAPAPPPFFAPSKPDYFVGREANLETLRDRLKQQGSVVPLAGMPGLGKTSLAIEFAHKHADDFEGVYWIHCAGLSLLAAATTLATQMGIQPEGPPETLLPEIRRRCGERHNLLVLDGVETNDFRDLIPGGRAAVLLTTRHAGLPFLAKYRAPDLKVFTTEDCLNLFREYQPPTPVDGHDSEYRKLAESLGNLPLGIAVAAGLLKSDVRYTLDRLLHETKLHQLAHGELDISQLLGSAIKSAPAAARQLLEAMAVCAPSGFRLGLAAEVAMMKETFALDALQDLRGRSLVEEIDRDNRRYRLHSLIRAAAGPDAALEQRHAEAVAARLETWEQHWRECEEDLPDWRLALDWAGSAPRAKRIALLKRLALSGFFFLYRRGLFADALHAMQVAGAAFEELGDRAGLAGSYGNQAVILQGWGKLEEAMALHKRVAAICEELGDPEGLLTSYGNQAFILMTWGKLEEAMALLKRQEAICRKLGHRAGLQAGYGNQALILQDWGKLEEAMALRKREEAIGKDLNDLVGLGRCYGNQALILQAWGRLEEAMALHKRHQAICEKFGDRASLQGSYANQALILKDLGRLEEAMALHKIEEALCQELGNRVGLQRSYGNQAVILKAWGKLEEAMALHQRQAAICEELGDRASLGSSYVNQAVILEAWGKLEEAMELYKRGEAICRELGLRYGLRISLHNQAILLDRMGAPEKAAPLRAEAAAIQAELMRGSGASA